MKRYTYMLMILADMLLLSCTVREQTETVDSQPAVVNLLLSNVSSESATSRSSGTLPTASDNATGHNEATLNHIAVALFDTENALVTYHEYDYSASQAEAVKTSTHAVKMLVFANVPESFFSGKTTLSDFDATALNLDYTTSVDGKSRTSYGTPNSQTKTALPMISELKTLDWSSTSIELNVQLKRVVARVALTGLTTELTEAGSSFSATEVFMYNASNQLTDWLTKTASGNVSGEYITANANTYYLGSGQFDTYSGIYYFYVFPHQSTAPTKLVIKGTYTAAGVSSTVYYPIIINKKISDNDNIQSEVSGGTDAQLDANATYGLSVVINGKGVPHVSDELTTNKVSVNTIIQPWKDNQKIVSVLQ